MVSGPITIPAAVMAPHVSSQRVTMHRRKHLKMAPESSHHSATSKQDSAPNLSLDVVRPRGEGWWIIERLRENFETPKKGQKIKRQTPTPKTDWIASFEAVTGVKPKGCHLRIYGCKAYPLKHLIPRSQKLAERAHIGYLVGYDSTNIYRIWIPSLCKVIRTRDVLFNENEFYNPEDIDLAQLLGRQREDFIQTLAIPSLPTPEDLSG